MEQQTDQNLWWAWALALVGAVTALLMGFAVTSGSQADAAIAGDNQVLDHATQDMETWHQSMDHPSLGAELRHDAGKHEDCVAGRPSRADMTTTRMGEMPTAGIRMGMEMSGN